MTLAKADIVRDSSVASTAAGVADAAVHLVFVPERQAPRFFLWGGAANDSPLAVLGDRSATRVLDDALQIRDVSGYALPLIATLRALAAMPASELPQLSPSVAVWSLAAKLVLDLIARERCVPRVVAAMDDAHATEARWAVALALPDDAQRVALLAKSFPLSAHAVPLTRAPTNKKSKPVIRVWSSESLLREFLDAAADAMLRAAVPLRRKRKSGKPVQDPWPQRFVAALGQPSSDKDSAAFAAQGFAERSLLAELDAWVQPALGAALGLPRACFRFELPDERLTPPRQQFELRFFLQASDDPSVLVSAADVFAESSSVNALHCNARAAEEQLLKSLVGAGRIFAPIELSLRQARPNSVPLKADAAWNFINDAAPAIAEAGMVVILPAELTRSGQRRLRMRMRIGQRAANQATGIAAPLLSLDDALLGFKWEAELDGALLTAADLTELAKLKAPLVRFRGQWVAVDRDELKQAQQLLAEVGGTLTRSAALAAALGGIGAEGADAGVSKLPIEVTVDGDLAHLLDQLRDEAAHAVVPTPSALRGELRPYQQRGLAWLAMMARLHLGACLADDMGLGKTIQLLAFLLHRRDDRGSDQVSARPILLVCPTSVLGNWQREIARFAPTIDVHPHYGSERARTPEALQALPAGSIVMTSYGLLRRDAALLGEVHWSVAVLDEAQNIKNASSRTARTARAINADFRVALTGTPVENRLTELWSICEFLNPGMLGSHEGFRREIALPIERFARADVADRLKHIVRPLILRRVKSDPTVIQDLPAKQEMTVYCTLTREQASLYQAALDAAMENIEGADGIARRGHVLALITALKQICNHPAQYLGEAGPLGGRSGKLERLREMLEETIATGDRVLVFTQYREMGDRLVRELARHFGNTLQYLHGGTPRATRDAMIKRFQEDVNGPRIFVLSLKAGGTGLNLTAATHVFHFDRWWNPAVEDQATDRAYRIGQRRNVQVHKFLCAGTIEERVNQMLAAKRDLAARIVGQGEQWITELNNEQLRELFSLAPNAVIGGDELGAEADDDTSTANSHRPRTRGKRKASRSNSAPVGGGRA